MKLVLVTNTSFCFHQRRLVVASFLLSYHHHSRHRQARPVLSCAATAACCSFSSTSNDNKRPAARFVPRGKARARVLRISKDDGSPLLRDEPVETKPASASEMVKSQTLREDKDAHRGTNSDDNEKAPVETETPTKLFTLRGSRKGARYSRASAASNRAATKSSDLFVPRQKTEESSSTSASASASATTEVSVEGIDSEYDMDDLSNYSKIIPTNVRVPMVTKAAKKLLARPVGSFTDDDFSMVRQKILRELAKHTSATDFQSLNLAIDLIERVVEERKRGSAPDEVNLDYLCHPRYYNQISMHWKEASFRNFDVISPIDLLQKIYKISKEFPNQCPFLPSVHHLILDVAIHQRHASQGPAIAKEIIEIIRTEADTSDRPYLEPGLDVYNRWLMAWAKSGRKEASDEMNDLLQHMRDRYVVPDERSYEAFEELNKERSEV